MSTDLLDRPFRGELSSQLSKREEMAAIILGGATGTQAQRPHEERVDEAVALADMLLARLDETKDPQ